MKIFLTGGAGFIGSNFVRYLLSETGVRQVINYDKLTYAGNLENLKDVEGDPRYRFVCGDICDRAALDEALPPETDLLINFAAESHVDRSIESAAEFIETNVLGVQALLDLSRRKGVRRFVQISTDEVMGSIEGDRYFNETSPLEPNSPYAASKAAAEMLVRAARMTFGLETVVVRSGNCYGPYQFPEKLIPLMISNTIKNVPLPVYGDGLQERDWVFVGDYARALWAVAMKGRAGAVYCIGARTQRTNLEVVRAVLAGLGRPESLIRYVQDRPGHDRRYALDPTRLEQELGWRPAESFASGLKRTIEWYRSNPSWIEKVTSGAYRDYYQRMYGRREGYR
ncbi:MAG: dTDP-glucose 4,6-dehydratase [Acidobacteria bacterium]|nr:dTDP-glucose 4,6-dehydratase [Acidobacteriota bacterium]